MLLSAGIIAGTFDFATNASSMQPINVTRLSQRATKIYVDHDMTIHLSHADNFEIISYTKDKVLTANDNKNNIDIKAKKGQTIYIDSQAGFNTEYYKIGGKMITVYS